MFLTLLTLLLLLLTAAADDAYTACMCVRKRINKRPCFLFVRHAVPRCAPDVGWSHCEKLCCESCQIHGNDWPVCRSAALTKLCEKYIDSDSDSDSDTDSDTDHDSDAVIGPMMIDKLPKPDKPEKDSKIAKTPKIKNSDMLASPEDELYTSEEPMYTPESESELELLPTPGEGEEMLEVYPTEDPEPTRVYPETTPEATASVEPPFDATNEGEINLAPARDRPFAPAACECMTLGTACDPALAAASGVCRHGVHASEQGIDCHFACCRICIVNMFATYCDNEPIVQACGL